VCAVADVVSAEKIAELEARRSLYVQGGASAKISWCPSSFHDPTLPLMID
jgi:hypothetical protein